MKKDSKYLFEPWEGEDEGGTQALRVSNQRLQQRLATLEAEAQQLRSLLNHAKVSAILTDSDYRIAGIVAAGIPTKRTHKRAGGGSLKEIAGLIPDENLLADAGLVMSTAEPRRARVKSSNGRTYLRRIQPRLAANGRSEGLVVTYVDINERAFSREIDIAEQVSEGILDSIREYAMATVDLGGRIREWTSAAERLLGYPALEAIGKNLGELMELDEAHAAEFGEHLKSEAHRIWQYTARFVRRDGTRIWCKATLHPLSERGPSPAAVLVVIRSDREEIPPEVVTDDTALRPVERINEIDEQFISHLAHELRTPLSAILLWVKLLSSERQAVSGGEVEEGLESIKKGAEELQTLVEDLVDCSRIARGRMRLDLTDLDPAAVVRAVVERWRKAAQCAGLRIQEDYDPEIGWISADVNRLGQIAGNLLSNAVKFTPAGGEIRIQVRRNSAGLELRIADTGEGVTAERLPRIFSRPGNQEKGTVRSRRGLGVGLYITQRIVQLHGGCIRVESAGINRGTTFVVSLPAPKPSEVSDESPSAGSGDEG